MKRKICSFLLAFLLLLAFTPAALADGAQLSYITDDAGILTASETASLEKRPRSTSRSATASAFILLP